VTGPRRVLIVEPEGTSGNWHYAVKLSGALAEEGLEVGLATLAPFEELPNHSTVPVFPIGKQAPAEVEHIEQGRTYDLNAARLNGSRNGSLVWPHLLSVQRFAYHVSKVRQLRKVVRDYRPDIVHVQLPLGKLDFLYFRYFKSLGIRVVYTAFQPSPLTSRGSLFERLRYQEADVILVHASSTVKQLIAGGIAERKIKSITHGNFTDLCQPLDVAPEQAKRLLGLPVDARVVLFFGAIEPRKGLDLLIEAFARLSRDDPKLHLVIAGFPNEDFAPYQERIRGSGAEDRVLLALRWVPFAEMQNYFNPADAVVLPYRRISQSGVLQLAYAYARPLVVTNVGGIAESVSQDGTGIVAAALDAEGIADAIRRLLSDRQEAERMGARGRRLAGTKYSWSRIAREVAGIYQEVCAEPSS